MASGKQRKAATKQPERQTKKQIAIGRKQAKQNRIIYISLAAIAVVVVAVLAVGIITELLVKPGQPVATVNGVKVPTDDYQDLLRYMRYNLHVNINQLQDTLDGLDQTDEQAALLASIYQQQLEQSQTSLALAPQQALDEMIEDELIRQEADQLGIAVTSDEARQAIDDDLRQALSQPAQTPITETEELPTPTPIPQKDLDQVFDSIISNMGIGEKPFLTIVQRGLLRDKLQEHLAGQVPTTGLVAQVQLIQTDTEEKANAALARIEQGEDFALVAQEVSSDTLSVADGGDLGWVTTGQLSPRYGQEVEDTVFSAETGKVVQVQSGERYYLILVADRDENGPLPESALQSRQNSALSDWLEEQMQSPETQIERLLQDSQIPDDPFQQTLVR